MIRGISNEEFIGFVRLEPTLKEADNAPIRGWYLLTGYNSDDDVDRGEIYVEATFQTTEKENYGPGVFQILKLIGKGRSGQVYQVRKKGSKQIYALKSVPKDRIVPKSALKHPKAGHQDMLDETRISVRRILAQSPFILSLKFSFETPTDLHIIVDYSSGGELFWHLQKEGRFEEMRAKFYIAEIILALQHLHHYDIVSYILKRESILLDANGHVSLCDFGLSTANPKQDIESQEYLAPEIIADLTSHTKVAHFWSLGTLFFEMTCGWSPFYAEDTEQLYKNVLHGKVRFPRDTLTIEGRNFVRGLLHRPPETRLGAQGGAEELKSHLFFADTDWDRVAQKLVAPPFKPKPHSQYSTADPDVSYTFNSASLNMREAASAQGLAPEQPLSPAT
jgi:serine/threonine protein kinase SCH9